MHKISSPMADTVYMATDGPTSAATQLFLTGEVTVETETAVPTEVQTESDSMTLSGTVSMIDGTFIPSNEMATIEPSTDSPSYSYTLETIEPTSPQDVTEDENSETPIDDDNVEVQRPNPPTTFLSEPTSSPSTAPTQLVLVVSRDGDSSEEQEDGDSSLESQVASATSNAQQQLRRPMHTSYLMPFLCLLLI